MKDVLAIITPAYANGFGEAANYAFVLAGLFEAHVTVLITEIEPAAPAPMSAPDLMQAGGEVAGPRSTNEDVAHAIELVQGAARRGEPLLWRQRLPLSLPMGCPGALRTIAARQSTCW